MTIFSEGTFDNGDATNPLTLDGEEPTSAASGVKPQGVRFTKHQIAIDAGDNSSGTITVLGKSVGAAANESIFESGSALVINLATSGEPLTRVLTDYCLESLSFTFASLGGNDDVAITVSSWDTGE